MLALILQIAPKRNCFSCSLVSYGNCRPPARHLPLMEQVDPAGPGGGFTCHTSRALPCVPTQADMQTCNISCRYGCVNRHTNILMCTRLKTFLLNKMVLLENDKVSGLVSVCAHVLVLYDPSVGSYHHLSRKYTNH